MTFGNTKKKQIIRPFEGEFGIGQKDITPPIGINNKNWGASSNVIKLRRYFYMAVR